MSIRLVAMIFLVLLAWNQGTTFAHEVRPGLLQLTEVAPGRFEVLWKVPARGDRVLALQPAFSNDCRQVTSPTARIADNASMSRWILDCGTQGMEGAEIRIDGLAATMIDVLVRIEWQNGTVKSQILRPNDTAFQVGGGAQAVPVWGYLTLGIEHILLGIDHLLFVLGLMLVVNGTWLLVKTITAFTVAHSITLGLATLGFVHVPQAPVEAVIALSIVFVASELARQRNEQPNVMARYPWIVAFTFGLLHGFGFAGALNEVGLPQTDIPLALLCFNVGVELGQLGFVGSVLGIMWVFHRAVGPTPLWLPQVAAYGIGSVASFWVIERVVIMAFGGSL